MNRKAGADGRVHRITDWQAPHLPAAFRVLNALPAGAARRLVPLDVASLLGWARRRTGLEHFGDASFREPLALVVEDLERSAQLTALGRITARTILRQLLFARLCVEDRLARRPELRGADVHAPVVIAGLPRTGTTHLHGLLAQVAGFRWLPLWETLLPLRPPGAMAALDARRTIVGLRLRFIDHLLPYLRAMHEMEVDLPHEELTLSAIGFRSFLFESTFVAPRYREWYAAHEHAAGYRYLQTVLAVLEHERTAAARLGARWLLKSPQHVDQLEALAAAFPDVRVVRTHRDPVRAVVSMVTMLVYSRRVCYRDLDVAAEARAWVDRLESMLRASMAQAARLPARQVLDVDFDEIVRDPLGTVRRVLAFADVEADARSLERVAHYEATHVRDRHGRVEYDAASLGLDPGELAERFRFYART